jgi:hypothetical protein
MSDVADVDDRPASGASSPSPAPVPAEPHLGWALAGMSAGAGAIHLAMTPIHAAVWQDALGFSATAWFQLVTAGAVLANRGGRRFYAAVAVVNLAFIAVWALSRTAGLPFGDAPGVAEQVGAIDAVAVVLQVGVVVLAARLAVAPERRGGSRLSPALIGVAALGLTTMVITSPDAANHRHAASPNAPVETVDAVVDRTRCDTSFNAPAYWKEAQTLEIDTRWGGNPAAAAPMASTTSHSDGHDHGATAPVVAAGPTTTLPPDPLVGRGSDGLDQLVSGTGLAATSEIEAAKFIITLAHASQQDYDAWLWWLRSSGTLDHAHAQPSTASGDPSVSGHGGHAGPQPWVAMTDQTQCAQLASELALARETALRYPTMQDAIDAGYQPDTPYLPGISNHMIRRDLLDGTFNIAEPEMILYDGNGPDAHVVGLSYQIQLAGGNQPTQGFTGPNDQAHRHMGLCYSKTDKTVIGDSTTTSADCEARGGTKGDGRKGWMSHAWVVPGCESPWGVFSAANPILDDALAEASGTNAGGCAGSGVRQRYGMGSS